jgi:hypothetical protein
VPVKLLITGIMTGIAILPVVPFTLGAKSYSTNFWAVPDAYPFLAFRVALGELGGPRVETFVLVALCALVLGRTPPVRRIVARQSPQAGFSASEFALLVAVQFELMMQWVLARSVTHAYHWHYSIESIAAVCVVGSILSARGCGRNSNVVLAVCCPLCLVRAPSSLRRLTEEGVHRDTRQQILGTVAALDTRMASSPNPLVAPHGNTFLQYYYYGSDRVKKNLVDA